MIKSCTLIEMLNSLAYPVESPTVTTFPLAGVQKGLSVDQRDVSSVKGKRVDSPPTFIRGKCQKNQNRKGQRSAHFENEGSGVVYARGRY